MRRMLRGPTLTISMERGSIRAVVLNGQKVVAWGVKSIEKHLPSESAEAGSQGDARAAALKDLLSEVGVRGARVVTDLPLFDSLMRQLEVPEMNRR